MAPGPRRCLGENRVNGWMVTSEGGSLQGNGKYEGCIEVMRIE